MQSNERTLLGSYLMDVGNIVEDDTAEEVIINPEQAPQLELEVVIEEMNPLEPHRLVLPWLLHVPCWPLLRAHARARSRSPAPPLFYGVCRENAPSHVMLRCGHAL